MAVVDGEWDCLTKSPLGEQKSIVTIKSDGDTFTGTNVGPLGSLDLLDGKIDGNVITWKMDMKVPIPIMLECNATIDGDTLVGGITAGAFGVSPITGVRKA